jgi:hypothetical protein
MNSWIEIIGARAVRGFKFLDRWSRGVYLRRGWIEGTFVAVALLSLGLGEALGQASEPPSPTDIGKAIAAVEDGTFDLLDIRLIVRANAISEIPELEKQFSKTEDRKKKEVIASALMRLHAKDDSEYWNFLTKDATEAIEIDAPSLFAYNDDGQMAKEQPSQAFLQWAKDQKMDPQEGFQLLYETYPSSVLNLASAADPRAIPLLRRALLSHQGLIEVWGSAGLAQLRDRDSIPLILEACKRAPADTAAVIAQWLVVFDDRDAQDVFDHYVPKMMAEELRRMKAKGESINPFY